MRGRNNPAAMGKIQKIDFKTVKRLMKYFGGANTVLFIVVVACIAVGALASVQGSLFLETLIDDYITPLIGMSSPVFDGLLSAIKTMAYIYIAGIIATFFRNLIMAFISQRILRSVRDDMFEHMQTLPIKYFDTNTFGDVMSRYTNDTDTLRQMFSQSIPQVLNSSITIVSVFIAMLRISIPLTGIVVLFVVLMTLVTATLGGKSAKYFVLQQNSLGAANGFIEEMINGQKVVKVFCHEEETKEEFDKRNEELCEDMINANSNANMMMPIMANLGNIQYVVIAVVGALFAVNGVGGLTLGMIVSFLQLSRSFNMPISQLSMQVNAVIMALAGAQRIFNLIDEEPETDEGYVTLVNAKLENGNIVESKERTGMWAWKHPHKDGTLTYTELKGDIVLSDVDFSYDGEKQVLYDISLYAHPGEKVAFVGATGAGKTTITNLINRFYDIADGKIRYDGININKIKKADLRHSLGIVLQETNLFTGTVMDNIRFGKLDATDEECINAAKLANADGFINRLPQGYNTMLEGNGANLSQGQRQLIAIARAAVADPPVMVLDEATSSIDTRTEALVQQGMDALMHGRTVFVIAHRLSTVKNSDVIMVIDHGRIIERGNHEQLIAQKGNYYKLYTGTTELE